MDTTDDHPMPVPTAEGPARTDAAWAAQLAAVDRQWQQERDQRAELLPLNKAALFEALATAGIAHIAVTFDGKPGEFFAFGPALCPSPTLVRVAPTVTRHVGATPELVASADLTLDQARALLDLDALRETGRTSAPLLPSRGGTRLLDCFLLDIHAPAASRIIGALRAISPNASTAADLVRHLALEPNAVHGALDLLASMDTMPRGDARIARLAARLRLEATDVAVVGLA